MQKKEIIKNIILIVIVIILLISCINMLLFFYKHRIEKAKEVELVSPYNNKFEIIDSYPMIDDLGKSMIYDEDNKNVQSFYEFEVKSKSEKKKKYEITVSDLDFSNSIHPNFIKVYLTDENNHPISGFDTLAVPTYYDLKVSSINPTAKRLYYGTIKAGEVKKYRLRVWVGDAYSIGIQTKKFGMKVNVEEE